MSTKWGIRVRRIWCNRWWADSIDEWLLGVCNIKLFLYNGGTVEAETRGHESVITSEAIGNILWWSRDECEIDIVRLGVGRLVIAESETGSESNAYKE
jgi:hypothetical protein